MPSVDSGLRFIRQRAESARHHQASWFTCVTTLSSAYIKKRRMMGSVNKSEKMRKEAVVAQFESVSRHLPGETEETTKTLVQARDFFPGLPEYKAGALPTRCDVRVPPVNCSTAQYWQVPTVLCNHVLLPLETNAAS